MSNDYRDVTARNVKKNDHYINHNSILDILQDTKNAIYYKM